MGLQIFEKRYKIGELVPCCGCLCEKHTANKDDEGHFICLNCGFNNKYALDSFPETNVKSVLADALRNKWKSGFQ